MTKNTTIQIEKETKAQLLDERAEYESNYNDTIKRLLGDANTPYVTETETREIVSEMVVLEALE